MVCFAFLTSQIPECRYRSSESTNHAIISQSSQQEISDCCRMQNSRRGFLCLSTSTANQQSI